MPTPLPGTAQTPLPGTAQTPLPGTAQTPGTVDNSLYNIPTGGTPITPNEYSSVNDSGGVPDVKPVHGRPSPYMVYTQMIMSYARTSYNFYLIMLPIFEQKFFF